MKNQNMKRIFMHITERLYKKTWLAAAIILMVASCKPYDDFKIQLAGPLALSASKSNVILTQKASAESAVNFTWTTGNNHETGASISYQLQIDKKGNSFANPVKFDLGKGVYAKNLSGAELNDYLLNFWKVAPNTATQFEARINAVIHADTEIKDVSALSTFSVTPYQPVSSTLYLTGSASPNGSSVSNALAMAPSSSDPTTFVYQGTLSAGEIKFITTLGQLLPSYQKGADDSHIVYRTTDSQPDSKFTIPVGGLFKVSVSLLDLTISIEKLVGPQYSAIYMVGSATPNGWDIANATKLVQSGSNPFIFTYTGVMTAGEFKFPVNRNTDWGQDMYMKVDDSHMYLHKGGSSGDDKWSIAKKGYYTLTLNLQDNTITINRTKLYMVGSATPIGWSIDKAIEMSEDATDGCIFTYTGPMVAGEFKFPVNRNTDWGQDMYMKTDDTHMYRHTGGASDDNKWTLTSAGNYAITANIEKLSISIQRQ